ncbi:hypothetical protein HOE31_04145 [bacterium]|jgi:hypothetical protein|nr:hypothetical protein [bacterium]MBT4122110.1 hypothetical protein [bacterium]MBT4335388.1 hypothetical protein [bacterium]MBT4495507.1 hypothetical protein [bacterium]MBT5401690.1 hypothetical protein [bacterium]
MKKMKKIWAGRFFWKVLSSTWGVIAMSLFMIEFFTFNDYLVATSSVAVIYIAVLTMYVGSKEFFRWRQKDTFKSRYFGEIHIILWTLLFVVFTLFAFFSKGYFKLPTEFLATYISTLGIFAITMQSKSFSKK